jgi:hypothetical protein
VITEEVQRLLGLRARDLEVVSSRLAGAGGGTDEDDDDDRSEEAALPTMRERASETRQER